MDRVSGIDQEASLLFYHRMLEIEVRVRHGQTDMLQKSVESGFVQ